MTQSPDELAKKIAQLEALRSSLGDAAVDAAIAALQARQHTQDFTRAAAVQEGIYGENYGQNIGVNLGTVVLGHAPREEERRRLVRYLDSLVSELNQLPLHTLHTRSRDRGEEIVLSSVFVMLATQKHKTFIQGTSTELKQYLAPNNLHSGDNRNITQALKPDYSPDLALPDEAIVNIVTERSSQGQRVILQRSQLAVEAVQQQRRLVLLGSPGSGKSTFLRYLAWLLAQRELGNLTTTQAISIQHWTGPTLPILLSCPNLARQLATEGVSDATVTSYLGNELARFGVTVDELLRSALNRGAMLLLLDGLDEVPIESMPDKYVDRQTVVQAIHNFALHYHQVTMVLTCRVQAFTNDLREQLDWPVATLAPFTLGQMRHFVASWYGELVRTSQLQPEHAAYYQDELINALVMNTRLRAMAQTPLLLTMMALLLFNRGELPHDRPQLYENILTLLLGQWDRVRGGITFAEAIGYFDWESNRIRPVLDELAYEAHRDATSEDGRGRLQWRTVQHKLAHYMEAQGMSRSEANRLSLAGLNYIEQRSGLLVSDRDDTYRFVHLVLQEHCAGRHIALNSEDPIGLVMQHRHDDRWREPIFLGMGLADPAYLNELLHELVDRDEKDLPKSIARWYRDLILAAEIGADRDWAYLQTQPRVKVVRLQAALRAGLVELLDDAAQPLPAAERARAGFLLGNLRDPRFPITIDEWRTEAAQALAGGTSCYFCKVEPGTYIIGSGEDDPDADNNEKPQHTVTFEQPFWITRYPITNAQWQAWLKVSEQPHGGISLDYQDHPNQPVSSVTWHWSNKFCEWLSRQTGVIMRLPSESEWEAAARGMDRRRYPWGNEWRADAAATDAGEDLDGWGFPMPVGCYPAGASPCGAVDTAGNVWEWTRGVWRTYPGAENAFMDESLRVLRGGSWQSNKLRLRCTARFTVSPDSSSGLHCGFRVVVFDNWKEWEGIVHEELVSRGEAIPKDLDAIPVTVCRYVLQRYYEANTATQALEYDTLTDRLYLQTAGQVQQWHNAWHQAKLTPEGRVAIDSLGTILTEVLGLIPGTFQDFQSVRACLVEAPALRLKLPPRFPLVFVAEPQPGSRTVQMLVDGIDVLRETGYFALVVPLEPPIREGDVVDQLRQAIKQSPHVQDFIVLSREDILDILIARNPAQALGRCIVDQVDLSVVSPFVVKGPVPETMFFGREAEVRLLLENASSSDFAIVGNRIIGKTSLLQRAYTRMNASGKVTPLLVNCQTVRDAAGFFTEFEGQIGQSLPDATPQGFATMLRSLRQQVPLPVLLLDEVDWLLADDHTQGEPLASMWRALAQEGVCHFVFCGSTGLARCLENPHSVFFNFPQPLPLSYLDASTAQMVLTQPLETLGIVLEDEETIVNGLVEVTSGHPNLVQYIGRELVNAANRRRERLIMVSDLDEVRSDSRFTDYYLMTIWGESGPLEKLITLVAPRDGFRIGEMKALLQEQGIDVKNHELEQALKMLVTYSILQRHERTYCFVPGSFYDILHRTQEIDWLIDNERRRLIERGI